MSMTMTQKILAAHAGLDKVEAGQLILVDLDRVLGNDITSPVAIREFEKIGATVVPMSTGNSKKLTTMMVDFGATAIACTPSYLLHLAEVLESENKIKDIKLKLFCCNLYIFNGLST